MRKFTMVLVAISMVMFLGSSVQAYTPTYDDTNLSADIYYSKSQVCTHFSSPANPSEPGHHGIVNCVRTYETVYYSLTSHEGLNGEVQIQVSVVGDVLGDLRGLFFDYDSDSDIQITNSSDVTNWGAGDDLDKGLTGPIRPLTPELRSAQPASARMTSPPPPSPSPVPPPSTSAESSVCV